MKTKLKKSDILKAWGLKEHDANVNDIGDSLAIVDGNITYIYSQIKDRFIIHAYRKMTKKIINYKLLNEINIATDFGTHVINDGIYEYTLEIRVPEAGNIAEELPIYITYAKRQAFLGYKILNTNSDVVRDKATKAHKENRDM